MSTLPSLGNLWWMTWEITWNGHSPSKYPSASLAQSLRSHHEIELLIHHESWKFFNLGKSLSEMELPFHGTVYKSSVKSGSLVHAFVWHHVLNHRGGQALRQVLPSGEAAAVKPLSGRAHSAKPSLPTWRKGHRQGGRNVHLWTSRKEMTQPFLCQPYSFASGSFCGQNI